MRREKKQTISLRLLCLALVLSMLLGLAACTTPQVNVEGTTTQGQGTTQTTGTTTVPVTSTPVATSEPTKPTDPEPTGPSGPQKEPLVYTLTQEDVDLFYSLLETCENLSVAGEDMDAIEAASDALDTQYEYLNAQYSIANILYYCDTYSSEMKTQYLDCVEICTEAHAAYIEMARRVYLSDTPAKDLLFEGWTEEDIAMLLAFDEEITNLQKRNEEITLAYNGAPKDDLKMELYIEFVQNNNKIAQYYGYDNYYEYAYEMVYTRDYSADALGELRQYAKDYLAPTFENAVTNFYNTFYGLGNSEQTTVINFLYNDYNTLSRNFVNLYLDEMPDSMADTMKYMLRMDSTFTNSRRAKEGAFTTTIGERSYCYFGPGYGNSCTVIHEAGHYYASRYADLGSLPLDLAEVHSQGNEWLFVHFMKDYMPQKQYTAMVNYRLYSDISTIMLSIMVDEFEQRVYTTDLTGFTSADFDALMDSVVSQYLPLTYVKDTITDVNQYWRAVVVDQPIYYISYGVSAISSISLYTLAQENFDAAVAVYQKLCEEPVLDAGFLGNIEAAGLSSPFDEQFYKDLQALIESRG